LHSKNLMATRSIRLRQSFGGHGQHK